MSVSKDDVGHVSKLPWLETNTFSRTAIGVFAWHIIAEDSNYICMREQGLAKCSPEETLLALLLGQQAIVENLVNSKERPS